MTTKWHSEACMEYGIELETESGAIFSLTWDPPGEREGIGLQRIPMLGSGVRRDADVAIWDVSGRSPSWKLMVGRRITSVDLHYIPWDAESGSLWCPHIKFRGGNSEVEVILADSEGGGLAPSADNVAVLHPGKSLPAWDN